MSVVYYLICKVRPESEPPIGRTVSTRLTRALRPQVRPEPPVGGTVSIRLTRALLPPGSL